MDHPRKKLTHAANKIPKVSLSISLASKYFWILFSIASVNRCYHFAIAIYRMKRIVKWNNLPFFAFQIERHRNRVPQKGRNDQDCCRHDYSCGWIFFQKPQKRNDPPEKRTDNVEEMNLCAYGRLYWLRKVSESWIKTTSFWSKPICFPLCFFHELLVQCVQPDFDLQGIWWISDTTRCVQVIKAQQVEKNWSREDFLRCDRLCP